MSLQPEFWYELLVDRDDPQSDVWFDSVEEALAAVRRYGQEHEARARVRLTWESRSGDVGLVAEGDVLDAWAQAAGGVPTGGPT